MEHREREREREREERNGESERLCGLYATGSGREMNQDIGGLSQQNRELAFDALCNCMCIK